MKKLMLSKHQLDEAVVDYLVARNMMQRRGKARIWVIVAEPQSEDPQVRVEVDWEET